MKALINANIYDFQNYRENGYILFDKEIQEVGPMNIFPGAKQCFDMKNALVMPGLVVGHTHMYSAFARGMQVPFHPQSFQDILTQLWWKLDAALDHEAVYYSGLVSSAEFIKNGVTTVIDHHAGGKIRGSLNRLKKAVCEDAGLRGIFCFETSDRFDADECMEENLSFAAVNSEKCAGMFGMHASMSLSDETLKKVSTRLRGMPIHIHVAESPEDEADSLQKYGKRVVERLEDFGLLNRNSILAHCVHVDEREAGIMAKAGVYVALNPTSNMNNAVGLPDYERFKEHGIKVLLGNDGLGFNVAREMLNLTFGMKHRKEHPLAFSLEDLLQVIRNGYEFAGRMLGIKIGRIEKGCKADMIAVPYMAPTPMNADNAFGHVFYGLFDHFHPREVLCDGEFVMKDYEIREELEAVYPAAQKIAKKVWEKIQ